MYGIHFWGDILGMFGITVLFYIILDYIMCNLCVPVCIEYIWKDATCTSWYGSPVSCFRFNPNLSCTKETIMFAPLVDNIFPGIQSPVNIKWYYLIDFSKFWDLGIERRYICVRCIINI